MDKASLIISEIIHQLFDIDQAAQLSRPDPQFGDYSTNVAMQLAGKLSKNPRDIAEQLIGKLREVGDFSEVTIAGPGFINLKVKDNALTSELENIISNPTSYGKSQIYNGKVVVTEYSDPNPFKVLHVGHFYTSVIGDAISNLIEYAGGKVHRVNFGGDVGLHVGKTMWAIINKLGGENPDKLAEIEESGRSEWMAACYVEGTRAYEDDEKSKSEIISINKKVYQLHTDNDHESAFAQIYWTCRTWSYDYFNAFYKRIGTTFEKYYPESETAALGLATVIEQKNNGVYQDSDGAIVFKGEPYGLHTRVFVNSEGLPTYEAKDVGLSIKKWQDYEFDESIIITGNDIIEYMKVVLKSIEQFKPELTARTKHITHGNVKLAGSVKMSSRKGNFLRAIDVLDMVADENEAVQGNRNEEPVLGAIKYAFLKFRIGADSVFIPQESVSLHGNSGPYLQYSLARANSVLQKLGDVNSAVDMTNNQYTQYERTLVFKLTEYPDVINQATVEFSPHYLCTYLYELAQVFNRFYENSKVVGDDREQLRSRLVVAYTIVLGNGLKVLGIPTPERM
ncbi:MAG: arginine--tRNA ligase [Candidatus Saccharibacteria bacterium]